jgi:hypothetical protein
MFKIYGTFQGNTELIDEVDTEKEARELQVEYMIAFGQGWEITIG